MSEPQKTPSPQEEQMDAPESAWVGPLVEELHRAMWLRREDGPARFREGLQRRSGIPINATDSDIENAYALISFAASAIAFSLPGASETLARLCSMLNQGGGIEVRRKAVLGWIERAIATWESPSERDRAVAVLHIMLGSADAKFASLEAGRVRIELGRSDSRSSARIAAALAVASGAFGDDDEDKSRKAFLGASKVSV